MHWWHFIKNTNRNRLYRLKILKYGQGMFDPKQILSWCDRWDGEATYRKLLLTLQAQLRPQGDDHFFACMLNIILERDEPPLSPQSQKNFYAQTRQRGKIIGGTHPACWFPSRNRRNLRYLANLKNKIDAGQWRKILPYALHQGTLRQIYHPVSMLISVCHA